MIEIYADVVFFINLIMDVLIFWVVSKLIRKNISFLRILLGGFVATMLFCLILFIPNLRILYNFFTLLLTLMLGIYISFRPKTIKEFIKLIFLANVTSFAVGGMGMALFYFTNISNTIGNMVGFYVSNFSLKFLIIISSTTYIFIKLFGEWFKKLFLSRKKFYEINIFIDEEEGNLTTLLDTGNSLVDPLSKSPVIIAEFEYIKNFLPDKLKIIFYENKEDDFHEVFLKLDAHFSRRVRMIPFASVGKQNGMLIGFRPDKVEIIDGKEMHTVDNVIIGIYNFKLSKDDSYHGLLNPELMPVNF